MTRLSGRHVVVTGGGTGIGRAIALRLAEEGARLTLLARDEARLQETATAATDADIATASVDIRDRAAVDTAFDGVVAARGPVHALVANAGIGGANMPGEGDRFDDLVATNVTGTYNCLRGAQRQLAPGPGARQLVVVSSILARIGVPAYTGYCASKTGILGLVRALAAELAPEQIQVNAICPGWVDTQMARDGIDGIAAAVGKTHEEAYEMAMGAVPLGRMSEPEDVAGLVAWLVSKDARGVTGQSLDMNGGAWM